MMVQLLSLGVLAAFSSLLFFPLNGRKGQLKKAALPYEYIPFIPAFIVPYLGFFPYVAFSMLAVLFFTPVAARMYVSLIFSGLIAALIWYFMPSRIERPDLTSRGIFTRAVKWMYQLDPQGNALPSAHASVAVLCSYYLAYAFPLHETMIWAAGATIVSSTLFVKQHHVSDLIAGIVLAFVSIAFSYLILGGI